MWNIRNAITNSNSAIIIMSQDYVNSLWCKEEFEQCYMETMKDPAFKLFVIMMQPEKELVSSSEYMESFFKHKTYLEKNDPKLGTKIADYLTWVKQPKENKKNIVQKLYSHKTISMVKPYRNHETRFIIVVKIELFNVFFFLICT